MAQTYEYGLSIPNEMGDLEKTIYLVRVSVAATGYARAYLYKVFSEKLWEPLFSSFAEFVQSAEGLNKSLAWASKNLEVYRHYVVEGSLEDTAIAFDTECLYLAAKTEGTPEEQLAKAKTLTRRELKEERNEEEPHEHEVISICKHCSIRL